MPRSRTRPAAAGLWSVPQGTAAQLDMPGRKGRIGLARGRDHARKDGEQATAGIDRWDAQDFFGATSSSRHKAEPSRLRRLASKGRGRIMEPVGLWGGGPRARSARPNARES